MASVLHTALTLPFRPHELTLRTALYSNPHIAPPANAKQVDGHTYERSAIEQWLKTHNTSPTTGLELESKQLNPNYSLRSLIRDSGHEAGV